MNRRLRLIGVLVALVCVLGIGLSAGIAVDRTWLNASDKPADAGLDTQLIEEAWNVIQQHYVDQPALKSQPLTYGAIEGMVAALGDTDHSRFLSPEMLREEHVMEQGQFDGIGAEVGMKDGHVTIIAPFDGSPAQRANLRPGDIIVKVDGQDVTGLLLDEVVKRILGQAGTSVTLTILDPATGNMRDVTLQRAHIMLHNVTWQMLPGTKIAHVRMTSFSNGATKDLQQALSDAQHQGATGLILDLRNNPGGLLDEAIGTASQFLSSGNVLQEKNAQGETTAVPVKPGGTATRIPMAVLINNGTASASEIVAGALQDAKRASLIGETTIGTGTVLNPFSLSDGSALLLAVEEWLTPNGRVIWHHGITPDINVPLATNATMLTPEAERSMTAEQLQTSSDNQLQKALSLLTQSATQ